jgi:hypothetical protein
MLADRITSGSTNSAVKCQSTRGLEIFAIHQSFAPSSDIRLYKRAQRPMTGWTQKDPAELRGSTQTQSCGVKGLLLGKKRL